ncbi:hypothetical protein GIB67_036563 [Kingdonia uniflora]|uniref:Ribosomal eL28/Mak16 domain-containing protein n=1 Tax=Kingdonia uniflora TaxID=39325 RepID=A0A7J7NZU1_9MAGN|nr:hypothetical protein GIB67_036563 [Kingdonia uniflora]
MAAIPGSLIREVVKRNNSFLVKEFGNESQMVQFSKEPNDFYNVSSFKHSGLANKKTVSIQAEGKEQNQPGKLRNESVMKEFRRMVKAVANQVLMEIYFLNCVYV